MKPIGYMHHGKLYTYIYIYNQFPVEFCVVSLFYFSCPWCPKIHVSQALSMKKREEPIECNGDQVQKTPKKKSSNNNKELQISHPILLSHTTLQRDSSFPNTI